MLTLVLALLPTASAATLTACGETPTTGCYATLQEAVDAAVDGDTIALPDGTYNERVLIDAKQLTISGASPVGVRLRGDLTAEPVVHITGGADVTLDSLLIASPVQQAIHVNGSTLTLSEAVLIGDAVQVAGGVLEARGSSVTLDSVSIGSGEAIYGGNIAVFDSVLTATTVELRDGHALVDGGAMYIAGTSTVVIDGNSQLTDNRADEHGGAIGVEEANPGVTLVVDGARLSENVADGEGGAISANQADVTLSLAVLLANSASSGGGMRASGPVTIARSKFCRNVVSGGGGGVDLDSADVTIVNSWFLENEALTTAAIDLTGGSGTTTLAFSHVVHNASEGGEAVQLPDDGSITVVGMLVAHNRGQTLPAEFAVDVPRIADGELLVDNNLFWDNASTRLATPFDNVSVVADPLLRDVGEGQCDGIPGGITPASAARDAGPASVLDNDGTQSDIGVYGGPEALLTWWLDRDADGWRAVYDCNDGSAALNPDAVDLPYDGIDTNCDLANDFDADGDGYVSDEWDGEDCNDDDDTWHPGAVDLASDNDDQDCDGEIARDGDQDGYNNVVHGGNDCDDNNATINPGAADQNPYRDMDCDGVRDIESPVSIVACTTTGGSPPLWWLVGLPMLLLRRRR